MTSLHYDVIVIGAGAAGMMCAIEAGKRGRRVLILEHTAKIGAKILISGGGRCNFTNLQVGAESFVSENPQFCQSALSRFTPADFIKLAEAHGIAYHEKKLGQLFCDHSARQIVALLVEECRKAGVTIQLSAPVHSIQRANGRFQIQVDGKLLTATALVVATGGLSIPKIGATDFGYRIARQFGLKIVPTAPALDGFVLPADLQKKLSLLAGVSLDCVVTCNAVSFRENLLFTHRGLSGPAMLQASLYWHDNDPLVIDLLPDCSIETWLLEKKRGGSRMELKNLLATLLPGNFIQLFTELYFSHDNLPLVQIPDQSLKIFATQLKHWRLIPSATVGFQKAEVTRGGVSTGELSSKTMESKKIPGLYFIGEVVDVTGWLGGYNFQWAWSSGWVAGQYV